MRELLFLAHRIPYPPDKGDKIRTFHLLQHLARGYRVHVADFTYLCPPPFDSPRTLLSRVIVAKSCPKKSWSGG
jgi:hypothetical protein